MHCEVCWIGGSTLLLGGVSLALSSLDPLDPSVVLPRLGVAALIGFVLSWIVCPARREETRSGGVGRPDAGDAGGAAGEDGDDGGGDGDGE